MPPLDRSAQLNYTQLITNQILGSVEKQFIFSGSLPCLAEITDERLKAAFLNHQISLMTTSTSLACDLSDLLTKTRHFKDQNQHIQETLSKFLQIKIIEEWKHKIHHPRKKQDEDSIPFGMYI